jgi:hypothetical protein
MFLGIVWASLCSGYESYFTVYWDMMLCSFVDRYLPNSQAVHYHIAKKNLQICFTSILFFPSVTSVTSRCF